MISALGLANFPLWCLAAAALACASLASAQAWPQPVASESVAPSTVVSASRLADFGSHKPTPDARAVADWVADSRDNAGANFIVVDKRGAAVYVFDDQGRVRGASPVLLGAAVGDDTVPGIGEKPLSQVQPHERTTPAGRFVAEAGRNMDGEDIVWVDYDAAVSMHRVRAKVAKERRLERLASKTVKDNRISYGCINIPRSFYETFISPTVSASRTIVYVLPEQKSIEQVFGAYRVKPGDTSAAQALPKASKRNGNAI